MLVKGGDDLRQDAVMEQLFVLVNGLLERNDATRKRHLKLRTYNVVPLSPDAGTYIYLMCQTFLYIQLKECT